MGPCEGLYLHNLTAGGLTVIGDDDVVHLPPLGATEMAPERLDRFDEEKLAGDPRVALVSEVTPEAEEHATAAFSIAGILGLLVGIGVTVLSGLEWGLVAFLVALVGGIVVGQQVTQARGSVVLRWLLERALLVLVLVVGFGSALVAAWLATFGATPPTRQILQQDLVEAFVVVIQAIFLGFAITFPALLYFSFERQRAESMRTRFLLNVFRLDHRLQTVTDVEARYGGRMRDVFGDGASFVQQSRRAAPILIATTVLSISLVAAFVRLRGEEAGGPAAVEEAVGQPLLSIMSPTREILPFAFLGAYIYAVNTSLRGYMRGDLRPKAYSQIAARMLIVVALSALLQSFTATTGSDAATEGGSSALVLTAAFFVGLVPNTFITRAFEVVRGALSFGKEKVGEPQPLTRLQGIDLYDRARLELEGVTNVEALVHGDLIDLMSQTRIPAGRLVDWLDQALLHLHVPTPVDGQEADGVTIADLVRRRIRSASQLLDVVGYRWGGAGEGEGLRLTPPGEIPLQEHDLYRRYRHVIEGIAAEPCMRRVLCWKQNVLPAPVVLEAPCSGGGGSGIAVTQPEAVGVGSQVGSQVGDGGPDAGSTAPAAGPELPRPRSTADAPTPTG